MPLAPLATVADLEARGVTVAASESGPVAVFLNVASALVRDAAGAPISQLTSTVTLDGTRASRLRLPGQPVRSVTTVEIDGAPVADWRLSNGSLWRACGWQSDHGPSEVSVTYVHGFPAVPADIVDLVCRLAARALVALRSGSDTAGLADRVAVSERIGDYSATYSYVDQFSDVELPTYKRDQLAARFGGVADVVRSR